MTFTRTHAISACLIGSGVVACVLAGRPLTQNSELDAPLNPLCINGSPYGEVFAMAMQGPIDTYFHGAMGTGAHYHESEESCDSCKAKTASAKNQAHSSPYFSLEHLLISLDRATETRTNSKPASAAHKRYLRRQVEDKLRFAYQLDPAHYANYNSLHFFLTEPQLGTRPELTPSAAKLAEDTIEYCLKQDGDPRPSLTAAAACTNILHLMFVDRHNATPKYDTAQMRQCLNLLNHCLDRYVSIAKQWDESKNWALLSPLRINECETRFSFISKIGEASEKTILRFEREPRNQQVSN